MQVLFFGECRILAFDHEIPKSFVLHDFALFSKENVGNQQTNWIKLFMLENMTFYRFDQSVRKSFN